MSLRSITCKTAFACIFTMLIAGTCCRGETQVSATSKPGGKWTSRPTVLVTDLPESPFDKGLDAMGGHPSNLAKATGFFQTRKIGSRWWLVTPEGGLFVSRGVNSVTQVNTRGGKEAFQQKFGSSERWADETLGLLRSNGFNTLGAWSDTDEFKGVKSPMPRCLTWTFMSGYGKLRGGTRQEPGHTGYPSDCPFVFDPQFVSFCDTYAKRLEAFKNDPSVIGHFSDNELPWSRKMLENYLSLPAEDPGHQAAAAWLRERRKSSGGSKTITEDDRSAFLEFAMDRYLTITSAAIRKYDPNHLVLGPRMHGAAIRLPEAFTALGKRVDVVCVNYYGAWSPDRALLEMWNRQSGRPVMITEFYAKAESSGMTNTGGAGWLVKTQKDRGAFYQNFTLGLMESRVCVGWHWHRYADNDPADTRLDPSNRDSNKGIVTNRYEPFTELLDSMKSVNQRVFGLIGHFDQSAP